MKTYTVTVAFYDGWNQQTVVVEAGSVEEACAKAIEIADNEHVDDYDAVSWDPGRTFVAGIADGPCEGCIPIDDGTVPFAYSEEAAIAGDARQNALIAALPHLEAAAECPKGGEANSAATAQLAAVIDQVRRAIGPELQATA